MKSTLINVALASSAALVSAVDMAKYQPADNVEPAFGEYLKELYASSEDPASAETFTDFFVAEVGKLIVLDNTAAGDAGIVAIKQALLPVTGEKHWNHKPNVTTVYAETAETKTYEVLGQIETSIDGGNCSLAYYSTRFTVTVVDGAAQLTAHANNLISYDDYLVSPAHSPTDIPCVAAPAGSIFDAITAHPLYHTITTHPLFKQAEAKIKELLAKPEGEAEKAEL